MVPRASPSIAPTEPVTMIHFAQITSEADYAAFKRGYDGQMARRSGGATRSVVKVEYLRQATRPMGCFDAAGRMIAGWVIQEDQPMLVPMAMPTDVRGRYLASVPRAQLCELTAIWRNDGISANLFAAVVWPRLVFDCITRGRRHILGIGYRNTMNEIYGRIAPTLIYNGPSQTIADTEVFVYDYSRRSMVGTLVANLVVRKLLPLVRRQPAGGP